MTDNERLVKVKVADDFVGDFQDQKIKMKIGEVMSYMRRAGVKESVLESEAAIGCIARGVDDLMVPGGDLSKYFKDCVCQLAHERGDM